MGGGLGVSDLTVVDGTVKAGIAYLSGTPAFEAEHGSQPDLCLIWNDFDVNAPAMDVVLYFHGFVLGDDGTPPLSSFVKVSGLFDARTGVTFTRRARPTLAIIPRGHRKPREGNAWPYRFPATIAEPDRIVALALSELAEARRRHSPAVISIDRLLLMAHSGGGLAVLEVLAKLKAPPTEIYLFDALYQKADALAEWATGALKRGDAAARLWVGYLGTTARHSKDLDDKLARLLADQPADVTARFQVDSVAGVEGDHMGVPRAYAPLLLQGDGPPLEHPHFAPPPGLHAMMLANANLAETALQDPARPIDGTPITAAALAAANGPVAPLQPATLPVDIAAVLEFLQDCITATPRVTYGLGAKIHPIASQPPGAGGFTKVDCSGFVRAALIRAAPHPPLLAFPDGSVVQHDWVKKQGFEAASIADGKKTDGILRVAFLRPRDAPSKIGHVALICNGRTIESHGGVGPDSRSWTGSDWQAKAHVYVLTGP